MTKNSSKQEQTRKAVQDANCSRWRNGWKMHRGCRNDAFTQDDYRLPVISMDELFGEYIVIDKPYDIVLNADDRKLEWNVLYLLQRDYSHLLLPSSSSLSSTPYSNHTRYNNNNNIDGNDVDDVVDNNVDGNVHTMTVVTTSSRTSDHHHHHHHHNNNNNEEKRSFKLCHQIDLETSGVCVIATTRDAASSIAKAFKMRQVVKYYVMIVYGRVDFSQLKNHPCMTLDTSNGDEVLIVRTWIKQRGKGKLKQYTTDVPLSVEEEQSSTQPQKHNHLQEAISRFKILIYGTYRGQSVTLLTARIITGRRHQLRFHCQLMNHHIVGDYVHGNKLLDAQTKAQRTMLHSYYIRIKAQMNGCRAFNKDEVLEFKTPKMQLDEYLENVEEYKIPIQDIGKITSF